MTRPAVVAAGASLCLAVVSSSGTVRTQSAEAPQPAIQMRCGTERVTVTPQGGAVQLEVAGQQYELKQVPAASGARYQAEGSPKMATERFELRDDGTLVLHARNGGTITATRR